MGENVFNRTTMLTPAANLTEDKTYQLTEKELWNILATLIKNVSSNSDDGLATQISDPPCVTPALNTTNSTELVEGIDDNDTMIIFVLVFFLWYGGLIFVCLIGFGVYKKPTSYEVYKQFVDRDDIREQLKQKKEEERKQRRLLRQHSTSSMMSAFSLPEHYGNGQLQLSNNQKLSRSYPSSKAMESLVRVEEDEALLESSEIESEQGSPYQHIKPNGLSNSAIFEA